MIDSEVIVNLGTLAVTVIGGLVGYLNLNGKRKHDSGKIGTQDMVIRSQTESIQELQNTILETNRLHNEYIQRERQETELRVRVKKKARSEMEIVKSRLYLECQSTVNHLKDIATEPNPFLWQTVNGKDCPLLLADAINTFGMALHHPLDSAISAIRDNITLSSLEACDPYSFNLLISDKIRFVNDAWRDILKKTGMVDVYSDIIETVIAGSVKPAVESIMLDALLGSSNPQYIHIVKYYKENKEEAEQIERMQEWEQPIKGSSNPFIDATD